jgi:hypothetical protein
MEDNLEIKAVDTFSDWLNETLRLIFDNIKNMSLSATIIIAGRYLESPGAKSNVHSFVDPGIGPIAVFIGWILLMLCIVQGILVIIKKVPRIQKHRRQSDGARFWAFVGIYLPLVISLLAFLLK